MVGILFCGLWNLLAKNPRILTFKWESSYRRRMTEFGFFREDRNMNGSRVDWFFVKWIINWSALFVHWFQTGNFRIEVDLIYWTHIDLIALFIHAFDWDKCENVNSSKYPEKSGSESNKSVIVNFYQVSCSWPLITDFEWHKWCTIIKQNAVIPNNSLFTKSRPWLFDQFGLKHKFRTSNSIVYDFWSDEFYLHFLHATNHHLDQVMRKIMTGIISRPTLKYI